jgi:AraC-like DNA-binding protein
VGQPPARYLDAQRLAETRQLLAYTNQTLAQIADHAGYSSPFHLSLRFKQHFGQSPRAFRQQKMEKQ